MVDKRNNNKTASSFGFLMFPEEEEESLPFARWKDIVLFAFTIYVTQFSTPASLPLPLSPGPSSCYDHSIFIPSFDMHIAK